MTSPRPLSYAFGEFRLDAAEKVLFQGDRPVPLTPKAVETLLALVERHGHLVTKEDLLRLVWPDTFVEENNLAQNISTLRRVLGDGSGGPALIETVPKRGYRFVGTVEEQTASAETKRAPGWPRAVLWVPIAVLAVTLVFVAWSRTGPAPARGSPKATPGGPVAGGSADAVTRIAVLPFVNLGSAEDEYFVAGMTEEITSRLAGLRRLAVPSGTTVRQYDRHGKSVREIGADLGVEYVLEGSVRSAHAPSGTQVRITPKLIRAAEDTAVWTQQYDASLTDILGVQGDIAHQVAESLQMTLEGRERQQVDARATADTEAYLAYLRGITAYHQGHSDTANQARARAELEEAVARDPKFALAWSWLARVYAELYKSGAERKPETREAARRAARKAVELDPDLPEGHVALAHVLMIETASDRALRELEIAQAGLPNSPELFRLTGAIEQKRGRWSEALRAYSRGFDVDAPFMADGKAVHYLLLRQYREAESLIGIARAGNRASVVVPEAWLRFSEGGDIAAARRVLEPALAGRSPADARVRGLLARLEWFDGRGRRALELIQAMDPAGAWLPPDFRFPAAVAAGEVYESMGRHAEAEKEFTGAMAELEARLRGDPDDYQIEAALGLAASGLGRSTEAVRHAERAVELLPLSRDAQAGPLYLYLLAGIQARAGQDDSAFSTLDRLFDVPGFYNETWVQRDPAFATLRRHAAFGAHLDRWSARKGDALLQP
jgi:DNA-binding winged helix-turn-helix (wHTH) protein/TolB-like protein/Tfp pilus assembly protein PilF